MIKTELISYAISNLNVHKSNPKYKTFCVKRIMNVQNTMQKWAKAQCEIEVCTTEKRSKCETTC